VLLVDPVNGGHVVGDLVLGEHAGDDDVCGLSTGDLVQVFLVSEPTMRARLTRRLAASGWIV
jgi:hypothetical protein